MWFVFMYAEGRVYACGGIMGASFQSTCLLIESVHLHTRICYKKTQVRRVGDEIIAGFAGAREVDLLSVYSVITTAHAQRLYTFHTDPDNSHKTQHPTKRVDRRLLHADGAARAEAGGKTLTDSFLHPMSFFSFLWSRPSTVLGDLA